MCRYHAHYELVVKLALDDVLSASVDIHVNALDAVYCLRMLTFT